MTILFWDIDGTLITTGKAGVPAWEQAIREVTGREFDLTSVGTLMEASPLVTITGAGGSGKTLLARHLERQRAARHRHGSVWVELRDVVADGDVPAATASALDLTIGRGSANGVSAALRN